MPYAEANLERIRQKIATQFHEPASRVVNMATKSPLAVVTGPFGNGKSETLLPLIQQGLQNRGFTVVTRDAQEAQYLMPNYGEGLVKDLPQTQKGVLIVDEAGEISDGGKGKDDVKNVLGNAHSLNYRVLSVIAYFAGNTKFRDVQTRTWQQAEKELFGSSVVYHMDPVRLDKDLFRQFIEARLALYERDVTPEAKSFVFDRVPTCLGIMGPLEFVLSNSRYEPSIRKLAMDTLGYMDKWRGMLTNQETDILQEDLRRTAIPGYGR